MLVLSRKLQEKIQIGDDITITILGINGRGIRARVEAPRKLRVLRAELDVPTPGQVAELKDKEEKTGIGKLVLSRKLNEKIKIGDDIVITILSIKGREVRVGIEAPKEVRVLRAELLRNDPPVESSDGQEVASVEEEGEEDSELKKILARIKMSRRGGRGRRGRRGKTAAA
jgi:carbon storage regulator CsrA